MTQLDRQGPSDPVSVPFTPGMRDNPEELAVIPDEIARAHELPSEPTPTQEFSEKWRNAAYDCFSSGHKFCREVCPVTQVTRNESWTPPAFHANVVAMDKSEMTIEDIASDYVNCTRCGLHGRTKAGQVVPMSWHCDDAAINYTDLPSVTKAWHEIVADLRRRTDVFDDWGIFAYTQGSTGVDYLTEIVGIWEQQLDDR